MIPPGSQKQPASVEPPRVVTPASTKPGAVTRAARAIQFARHMPVSKLARRAQLTIARAVADRWPWAPSPITDSPAAQCDPLPPIFPARLSALSEANQHRTFTFLNLSHQMPAHGVDWSAPAPGAAHQLWRMNLHYMEYLESVSDPLFCELVSDWIEHHPPGKRGAWRDSWNSYALSLRVVVWMQQLAIRRDISPTLRARAEQSLVGQLRFLMRNLETDLGGNHLIKNLKALLWAGRYFAGTEAQRWHAKGLALLQRELTHQILPDGVHDERSLSYHAQVFADLLECHWVLLPEPICPALDGALDRLAQALADLTHPDGFGAQFNDAGFTMAYAPAVCLKTYERLLGKAPAPRPVFAYPHAGYYGMRAKAAYLIADCGRIGPDDLPAHGHGDILSFELSIAGERLIVDQGVFEYRAGPRRQASRSARNHNTLCFDNADQADFFGAFRCGRRPNPTVRSFIPTTTGFILTGTHDGYASLPGRPRHLRTFEATPDDLTITDRLEGSSEIPATVSFLLHPNVQVDRVDTSLRLTRGEAVLTLTASLAITIESAVWWPDMGQELPTVRLRVQLTPSTSTLITHLSWSVAPLKSIALAGASP